MAFARPHLALRSSRYESMNTLANHPVCKFVENYIRARHGSPERGRLVGPGKVIWLFNVGCGISVVCWVYVNEEATPFIFFECAFGRIPGEALGDFCEEIASRAFGLEYPVRLCVVNRALAAVQYRAPADLVDEEGTEALFDCALTTAAQLLEELGPQFALLPV